MSSEHFSFIIRRVQIPSAAPSHSHLCARASSPTKINRNCTTLPSLQPTSAKKPSALPHPHPPHLHLPSIPLHYSLISLLPSDQQPLNNATKHCKTLPQLQPTSAKQLGAGPVKQQHELEAGADGVGEVEGAPEVKGAAPTHRAQSCDKCRRKLMSGGKVVMCEGDGRRDVTVVEGG